MVKADADADADESTQDVRRVTLSRCFYFLNCDLNGSMRYGVDLGIYDKFDVQNAFTADAEPRFKLDT